jgi:hypothetical protein
MYNIVFFGESLPPRFHKLLHSDLEKADLLLVMGTSLQVAPVSMIPDMVDCRRVLFNRDKVMKIGPDDIFIPGDCDTNVQLLADLLGWGEELAEANATCQLQNRRDDDEKHDEEEDKQEEEEDKQDNDEVEQDDVKEKQGDKEDSTGADSEERADDSDEKESTKTDKSN